MSVATFSISHPNISQLPQTLINLPSLAGDSVLYVQNSTVFPQGNYVCAGQYGDPQAETLLVSGAAPSVSQITVGNVGFPHPLDTPVTLMPFTVVKAYVSTTGLGGTYTFLSSVPIQVSQSYTTFTDYASNPVYSYRFTFYNPNLNVETDYSAEIPYSGFPLYSLQSIVKRVLGLYVDNLGEFISPASITDWCNELLARVNREVTDSESALFANFITFTPGSAEYTDMSSYNMEVIHLIEYSTDGGANYYDTINPTDSRIRSLNPTSTYTWFMEGDKLFITGPSAPNSNFVVRVWYYAQQTPLLQQSDTLPTIYRSYSDVWVDYCMVRASEQSRRLSESATYYDRKFIDGFTTIVENVRGRINQGNKSISTTWIQGIPDFFN